MIRVRDDKTAQELRDELDIVARTGKCGRVVIKVLGIANVLDGMERKEAAKKAGLKPQCLADAIKRYNAEGIDGLWHKQGAGRPSKLTHEQRLELKKLVLEGPEDSKNGCIEYNAQGIKALIRDTWGVSLHVSNVCRTLHKLELVKLSCRPVHEKTDPVQQEEFRLGFPGILARIKAEHPEAQNIEVWVQDETRIGQKGKSGRRWAEKGSSPRAVVQGGFKSMWLFGAFCPERDIAEGMVYETVNTDAMNAHLKAVSERVLPNSHAAMLIDGAGFHAHSKGLIVPPNMTLITLPSYSPELNPAEIVWKFLKRGPLLHRLYRNLDEIEERCCAAWRWLINRQNRIQSLCSFPWLVDHAA